MRCDAIAAEESEVGKGSPIFFCGGVHGNFHHIIDAVELYLPGAIVLLGDLQCQKPLE